MGSVEGVYLKKMEICNAKCIMTIHTPGGFLTILDEAHTPVGFASG
jgi:hypothetical protein